MPKGKRQKDQDHVISVVDGDKCTCPINIDKQKFRALLDTGATVSIISDQSVKNKQNKIIPSSVNLKTVSGQHLKVLGQIFLKVKLGTTSVSHWFHVVKGITNSLILGFDFISKNNVQLNFTPDGNYLRMGNSRVTHIS